MPVALAPSPLAPGFPRTWPECQPAMGAIARHLIAMGADDEEVMLCLMIDFPDLPSGSGAAWRSDAYVANVTAHEKMFLSRHADLVESIRDEPSGYELQVVTSAAELLRLCASYGVAIGYDAAAAQLTLSRKVMIGGPVHTLITRYKPEIILLLGGPA